MNYREFLRRLPKAELHIHFEGSVRPGTFFELAKKHGLALPSEDPATFYAYDTLVEFLKVYDIVCRSIRDQEDFALAALAYETLEDGVRLGNLKYREMFFNPTTHTREGISYRTILDGILEGTRAAERDFGVQCRLIPAIHRGHTPAEAVEMVEAMAKARCDEIIGLGSDALPDDGTEGLQHFTAAYALGRAKGLRLTAHCAESRGTEQNFTYALDHRQMRADRPWLRGRARSGDDCARARRGNLVYLLPLGLRGRPRLARPRRVGRSAG